METSVLVGFILMGTLGGVGFYTANAQQLGFCHQAFNVRFLGHCYWKNRADRWASAQSNCESILAGSHLLTDMTEEKHQELLNQFSDLDSFWLGLSDRGTEGSFVWDDLADTPLGSPTQWDPNTPNTGGRDCVAITGSSWVPMDCNTQLPYICEKDVDECADNPCDEHAVCTNTKGSFTCTCDDGYTGNGLTCTARCSQSCNASALCRSTDGSNYACVCNDGFEGDGVTCTDIDECLDPDAARCHVEHGNCVNTPGSFDCFCNPGYQRTSGDLHECEDVDECLAIKNRHPCSPDAHCDNSIGSFRCDCNPGYTGNGYECVDIDECATGQHNCHVNADCVNQVPASSDHEEGSEHDAVVGFTCTCKPGYQGDGVTCEDADECLETPYPCDANADCTNIVSSYTCACRDGFQGDGMNCTDIDECAGGQVQCHALATCVNTVGSYLCRCRDGFQGDGITSCADEDECLATPSPCPANTDCTNNVGSYSCQCKAGFTGTPPDNCIDVDECANNAQLCNAPSVCVNTPGSHVCQCTNGYQYDGSQCVDANECDGNPCDPNADCANTVGSYTCTCRPGFVGNGLVCTDVDECTGTPCHVNADCTNTIGNYTCTCHVGYEGDGKVCNDADECSRTPRPCHDQADCTNTPGSYTCRCRVPYRGDGIQCTNDPNTNCVTGANGVITCTCKPGYTGNGYTCTDADECAGTPRRCHEQATCTNTLGSFRCTCNQGYQGDGLTCTSTTGGVCAGFAGGSHGTHTYQVVLDGVTLTDELRDTNTEPYRSLTADIAVLVNNVMKTTQHAGKVKNVLVTRLKEVEGEVVAVYDACLENANAAQGLEIQNNIQAASSVDNTLGINLKTACYLESDDSNCPTSASVSGGGSGLNPSTAIALWVSLALLLLLLLLALCCAWRHHRGKKYYDDKSEYDYPPSIHGSVYHSPQSHVYDYPTATAPTVVPIAPPMPEYLATRRPSSLRRKSMSTSVPPYSTPRRLSNASTAYTNPRKPSLTGSAYSRNRLSSMPSTYIPNAPLPTLMDDDIDSSEGREAQSLSFFTDEDQNVHSMEVSLQMK
ncbi:fibrillin-1-like [Branchiostoma floridae]|uniref:Fibrillin-1-like n=1 Tax=Branchiostoma floridae TaxID=7739 RepID=A0A9J7LUN6_BRAFL|nr:fibrillin-1-like [Branchiostoma floridae]